MAAFDAYSTLDQNVLRYRENRDVLLRGLPPEFLGDMAPADGAFYIYADLTQLADGLNSVDFADALLVDAHVACTPEWILTRSLAISTYGSPMPAAKMTC